MQIAKYHTYLSKGTQLNLIALLSWPTEKLQLVSPYPLCRVCQDLIFQWGIRPQWGQSAEADFYPFIGHQNLNIVSNTLHSELLQYCSFSFLEPFYICYCIMKIESDFKYCKNIYLFVFCDFRFQYID